MKSRLAGRPTDGGLRGLRGYTTVGAIAVAATLVLTLGNPHPEETRQGAIDAYVRSIERNDIPSACLHATQAADLYLQQGDDPVGLGWQTIAHAVCPDGQVRNVAHLGS